MAIFALLDLDNTLIDTDAKNLNQSLLDALKAHGIRDLCLFTNMNKQQILNDLTNPDAVFTRPAIIAELERQGFVVHRVITPADQFRKDGKIGNYYAKKWLPAFNKAKKIKADDTQIDKIAEIIKDVDDDIDEYMQLIDNQVNDILKFGRNSAAAKQAVKEYIDNNKNNKGDMYQLVCENLKEIPKTGNVTVDSFVLCDDSIDEINYVIEKSKQLGHLVPLTCMEVRKSESKKKQASDILSTDQAEVKTRYFDAIRKHKQMVANKKQAITNLKLALQEHKLSTADINQLYDAAGKISADVKKPVPVYQRLMVEICNHHQQVWEALIRQAAKVHAAENLFAFQRAQEILNDVDTHTVDSLIAQWNLLWLPYLEQRALYQVNIDGNTYRILKNINAYIEKNQELPVNFKQGLDLLVKELSASIFESGSAPLFSKILSYAKHTVSLQKQKASSVVTIDPEINQFLLSFENFLTKHMAALQAKTLLGSTAMPAYQEILASEKSDQDKYLELLFVANHAINKREQTNGLSTFFKYSGDKVAVTELHRIITLAALNVNEAIIQLNAMDREMNADHISKQELPAAQEASQVKMLK